MDSFKINFNVPFEINKKQATILSEEFSSLDSQIYISKDDCYRKCNAKSSLGLLSLNIDKLDNVSIQVNGQNCIADATKIQNYFNLPPS